MKLAAVEHDGDVGVQNPIGSSGWGKLVDPVGCWASASVSRPSVYDAQCCAEVCPAYAEIGLCEKHGIEILGER